MNTTIETVFSEAALTEAMMFEKALTILKAGWCKYAFINCNNRTKQRRYCLISALKIAANYDPITTTKLSTMFCHANDIEYGQDPIQAVVNWNDKLWRCRFHITTAFIAAINYACKLAGVIEPQPSTCWYAQ